MTEIVVGTTSPQCGVLVFPEAYSDIAIAFVRLLGGNITPDQFFQVVTTVAPDTIEFARKLVEACVGPGA